MRSRSIWRLARGDIGPSPFLQRHRPRIRGASTEFKQGSRYPLRLNAPPDLKPFVGTARIRYLAPAAVQFATRTIVNSSVHHTTPPSETA
jgi:hypothetical protein